MREGVPFWIIVGAHGQKCESSLDRKINLLTSKSHDAVTATNYDELVLTLYLYH